MPPGAEPGATISFSLPAARWMATRSKLGLLAKASKAMGKPKATAPDKAAEEAAKKKELAAAKKAAEEAAAKAAEEAAAKTAAEEAVAARAAEEAAAATLAATPPAADMKIARASGVGAFLQQQPKWVQDLAAGLCLCVPV